MKFNKLSKIAKHKAVTDYIAGWLETHEDDQLDYEDVADLLLATDDCEYDKEGNFIEQY
jgi:hypothetical protein